MWVYIYACVLGVCLWRLNDLVKIPLSVGGCAPQQSSIAITVLQVDSSNEYALRCRLASHIFRSQWKEAMSFLDRVGLESLPLSCMFEAAYVCFRANPIPDSPEAMGCLDTAYNGLDRLRKETPSMSVQALHLMAQIVSQGKKKKKTNRHVTAPTMWYRHIPPHGI